MELQKQRTQGSEGEGIICRYKQNSVLQIFVFLYMVKKIANNRTFTCLHNLEHLNLQFLFQIFSLMKEMMKVDNSLIYKKSYLL